MTHSQEETSGLERRAIATRTRLVDTIDALERRGAHILATVNDARRLFALVADGAAVVGAVTTLVTLVRMGTHRGRTARPTRRSIFGHVVLLGALAGVAFMATRTAPPSRRNLPAPARLRAI